MSDALVCHVPPTVMRGDPAAMGFWRPLTKGLAARGLRVKLVLHDRDRALAEVEADQGFHLFDFGRTRHPRALNTASAYLPPFRYFDPQGVRALSSIGDQQFDAQSVAADPAQALFDRLRLAYVAGRKSRYDQPDEVVLVPQGCIAVFLQSEGHRQVEETCHLSMRQMIKALLDRDDPRPIVVKPHPRDTDMDTLTWLGQKARKDKRLHLLPVNIHDILAAADVVVTINSAVGVEAMLHEKPVVLCGQADFHHICEVVTRRDLMEAAIARALTRKAAGDWPFARFIGWFYGQMCLDPTAPEFLDRLLARIAATGYDLRLIGG